ncbi:uncharacterized protein LOC109851090 [Asparagus officinalis]|uniref:uncharacterized protein LOC109851090 n=1 Tax=Asparagus officinalis TaxID=4686 RepID=UPI00098E6F34|nr:uncharacterized protein LOC109851090 [Asparagus officinalis]
MSLLGPPQLRHLPPPPAATSGEPFLDLMDTNFYDRQLLSGLIENNSATFLSSGNPALDFFFQVVPDTTAGIVTGLLSSAWTQDPLTALKLVALLHGVHGTGKSDREGFYAAALWLHENHPKTLALNVVSFAEFVYMKDLLEILYGLLHGINT